MNISLSEVMVILLIALLVIKPEQLPDAAYALGKLAQSLSHFYSKLKNEMTGFIDSVADSNESKRGK